MEYTIQRLSRLAGVSTRTLRYYDELGILKPVRIGSSGRIYGANEVERLQQLLFYRELGVPLAEIGRILSSPDFDGAAALRGHRDKLLERRRQLDLLIANVEKTIASEEGRTTMSDKERFEGLKRKMVEDNEREFGAEVRERYGDAEADAANRKVLGMTEEQYTEVSELANKIIELLLEAYAAGDPACEAAQQAVDTHRRWLCYFYDGYNSEYHRGLGELYVADERFREHYDKHQPGLSEFLRDAINIYTS